MQPLVNDADKLAASFVPAILRSQYANDPGRKMGDPLKEDHVTLLWIDLCNFSPLCSRLMKDTLSGVEKIAGILNNHYDFVLNLVAAYCGQPLFFAGDGLMCGWPGDKSKAAESVQLAAACAFKIIEERNTLDDKKERFSLHVILSMGPWQMAELEGIHGNRLVSFFGEVFNDLSLASKNGAPNQLLITNTALSFLSSELKSNPVDYGASILHDAPTLQDFTDAGCLPLPDEAMQELQLFVPRTLTFPLNAEHFKWIAEIRPVTILFVRLPNNGKSASENLSMLHESVALARPLVQKYDGLLNQVWMDEKESNMLICFGPPPSAHIDDPERSVRLGFEIHQLLKKSKIDNSVGISNGMAYCGILGNHSLRHYTVIGDVVNKSAHIAGIKKNEIFCDKATYSVSNKSVNYSGQINATVKGSKEPISLYIPKSLLDESLVESDIPVSIGRKNELAILIQAFQNIISGKTECILMEGESGMGKTRLLKEFTRGIASENCLIAEATGDFLLRNTPYASMRAVIATILDINHLQPEVSPAAVQENLLSRFGNQACLLNIVLHTAIPESEEIRTLTGNQRVQATHDFLLALLEKESKHKPLVLVIDDARWVDESTWKLLVSVKEQLTTCLVILAFQTAEGLSEVEHLKELGARNCSLQALADKDIETLVCAKLGVGSISRDIADIIRSMSKGNPFFCTELTDSLIDQELLVYSNNSCSLVEDARTKNLSLPETVRGAVRMRIDRLGQGSQLSLKVGSVVGNRFSEKIICSIYPIVSERPSVPFFLNEVEQYGFLNETVVDNLNGYLFMNATTVEVAYEMTLAEQRRQLHKESAEWYEQNFKDNLPPFYFRLANHWNEANEKDKAEVYYELEAMRLFRLGFVKEALDVGLESVKLLGQSIPRDLPSIGQTIGENMGAIAALMQDKDIESLIDHKKLKDPKTEKLIKLLLSLGPFAYQSQQGELFALMTILCQRLTLEFGNGESAAEVYAMYSIIYQAFTGDTNTTFRWSNLSLEVDKKNNYTLQSRVLFIHGWFIGHWKLPIAQLIPLSYIGADAGFRTGDTIFACFNLSLAVIQKSTCGKQLAEVIQTAVEHFARNNNTVINTAFHLMHEEQVAKAFQGRTINYTSLTDEKYDEEKDIASICKTDLFNQIAYYFVSKLKLHVHFGNWEEANSWAEKAIPLLPAFANQPGQIELEQFYTIAALYQAAASNGEIAANFLVIANAGIDKFNGWAQLCPSNFLHKALLLEAIREGFDGDGITAEKKFTQAAETALDAGYIQDRGLAFEHLVRMKKRMGINYSSDIRLAIDAYQQWGADGKVRHLHEQFIN